MTIVQTNRLLLVASAIAIWTVMPSTAFGSDFGSTVFFGLLIIAGVILASLVVGIVTAVVLVKFTKRRWIWFLVPVFAVMWWAIGYMAMGIFYGIQHSIERLGLWIVFGIILAILIGGIITAALLVRLTKQRWIWWLVPVFAMMWAVIGEVLGPEVVKLGFKLLGVD